jgi:hypothetical protein
VACLRRSVRLALELVVALRLIASLIVRNEFGRYLGPCIDHLLEFCDEILVLDEGSTDGWSDPRVTCLREPPRYGDAFFDHAAARQRLLDFTIALDPTHILAIDADEFITDGAAVRKACEETPAGALHVCLQEVWRVRRDGLDIRQDGGWVERDCALLWRPDRVKNLTITDRGHATGRTPDAVGGLPSSHSCSALLHLGWSNVNERAERFERYAVGDAGKYHAKAHIDSIMWPDERIKLQSTAWPEALEPWRGELVKRSNR